MLLTYLTKHITCIKREKISRCGHVLFISSLLFFAASSQNIFAANETQPSGETQSPEISLCPATDTAATKYIKPRIFPAEEKDNVEISADFTQSSRDGSTSLDGNVIIEKHLLRITADHAHYSKQKDNIEVSGNVHIDTETLSLDADAGSVNTNQSIEQTTDQDSRQGKFSNIRFFIPSSNMKGKAETIHTGRQSESIATSVLNNASITSCSLLDPDWLISADEIELDHIDEYGSADDVVVRFKGVPFLYTPYIEFPTSDKRRSGLLFPEVGTSSPRGAELALPWYWNIAPNHDAVIVPRYMEKRGLELGGNYRFLTRSSEGELRGTYLPKDDITQDDRYQIRYLQHSQFFPRLLFDADIQDVSDTNYFNDFSNSLGSTSQTHLNSVASLRYGYNNWHAKALVQDIQSIDSTIAITDRPYQRLPQLTFFGDQEIAASPLLFTLDSEFVNFTHDDDNKITGSRFTVRPGLRLPLNGASWFIDPAVKFSHTQYDTDVDTTASQNVESRNLPISSIDAGLFFERQLDSGYQHTLEPRIYYLHVPFEDQANAPVFDTSIPDFSVAQLFRDNRFVGGDRIGDANQLTLALTSRILNPASGNEFLRASIGQIFYFADRRVSLDDTIDSARQSDVIAELDANWGNWQSNIALQWDRSDNRLSKQNYFLHYMSDARHIFNIGYRRRLDKDIPDSNDLDLEQTDTSFVYAINREYSALARWNYSLKDDKNIDSIAGIAYDSCCWAIQLLAQRRLRNTTSINDAYDNAILVQFVFKGLGSLSGSKAKTTLQQSIYGYTDVLQ